MYSARMRVFYLVATIMLILSCGIVANVTLYEDGSFGLWGMSGCLPYWFCDDSVELLGEEEFDTEQERENVVLIVVSPARDSWLCKHFIEPYYDWPMTLVNTICVSYDMERIEAYHWTH